jgi:CheY-like chemotaxis protein
MNHVAADLKTMTRLQELGNLCGRAGVQIQEYLDAVLDTAIDLTGADKGNIQLFEVRSSPLKIATQRRFDQAFLDFFAEVKWEEPSACAAAMRQAGRVVVEDVSRSEIFRGQESLEVLLHAGVRAVQSTPLISSAGNLLGIISTHFDTTRRFTEGELLLIDLLTRQAADFLERKRGEGLTIVVVEDHDDARRYISASLRQRGASVVEARNGIEGLEAIKTHRPTLVLSDIFMPGADGFQVVREIRALKNDGQIPVVAMTTAQSETHRERILAAGFSAYLPKPFTPNSLLETIRSVLGDRGSF